MTCPYKKAIEDNKSFISEALQLVKELTNIVDSYWYLVPEKYEPSITEDYLEVLGFLKEFNFKVKSLDLTIQKFVHHNTYCSNFSCSSLIMNEEDINNFKNIHKQTIELKNVINNIPIAVNNFTNKSKLHIKIPWK